MLTPKEIFEEKIATRLKQNPDLTHKERTIYQFHITGEQGGDWYLTFDDAQGSVNQGSAEHPHCVITLADADLMSLVQGNLKPQMAFMTGKLKIKGDLGLAFKLGSLFKA